MTFSESGPVPAQGGVAQQIFWYTAFTADMTSPGLPVVNEDGTPKVNDKGEPVMELAPPGTYTISVEGSIAGKNEAIATSVYAPVTSITLGNGTTQGLLLNVFGQGQKKLSDIEEIAT